MGIKESTCDERWVLDVSDESLNSTPETNFSLYVNYLKFKLKKFISSFLKWETHLILYFLANRK